ncbi:MAG TPA: universal stress protein [Gammaproteobacteria bacterium]
MSEDLDPLRHIMIVVDPAMRHSTAFLRGVELAKRSGASLTLVLAIFNDALSRAGFLDPGLMERSVEGLLSVRRRWLDDEIAALQEQGVIAAGVVAWYKPAYEEIARQALERRPDLVLKDIEPSARFARAVFTPADWHLMRTCPVPLMLVDSHASSYPLRILAAVDPFDSHAKPAELNDGILRAARGMAHQFGAEVHVVHAYQYLPAAAPTGAEMAYADARLFAQVRDEHRRQFLSFGEAHGIPEERMHLVEGEPADAIAGLARDINADLVVLGTTHRTGLKRLLMGSTAEEILGAIRNDVLVLKPAAFTATLEEELGAIDRDHGFSSSEELPRLSPR